MATSETAPALRTRLQGFDATDEEFRKIFDVMQPLDDKTAQIIAQMPDVRLMQRYGLAPATDLLGRAVGKIKFAEQTHHIRSKAVGLGRGLLCRLPHDKASGAWPDGGPTVAVLESF